MAICKENTRGQFLASTSPPSTTTLERYVDSYICKENIRGQFLVFVFALYCIVCFIDCTQCAKSHEIHRDSMNKKQKYYNNVIQSTQRVCK